MNKIEFISWLENSSSFERMYRESSENWKQLVDYGEYISDILEINDDNTVSFTYEKYSWGRTETITDEYGFEEFINKYENYELKNG